MAFDGSGYRGARNAGNPTSVIDNINRLLEGLIRLLLPLVVLIVVLFLTTLPIVGLQPLWSTGNGTALLMWLSALILFCVNAVYRTGLETPPYSPLLQRFIYIGISVLPLISGLVFYGLWLRIDQYGWSVERCWAMLVWAILTCFSLGYASSVLRRAMHWYRSLSVVNIWMGWVLLCAMLLVNSPLLDFRKIALGSQVARVASSEIAWQDFDFYYTTRNLGRPGYMLKQDLLRDVARDEGALRDLIEKPRRQFAGRPQTNIEQLLAQATFRPARFDVPDAVKTRLRTIGMMNEHTQYVLVQVDLNHDGREEIVVIGTYAGHINFAILFDENLEAPMTSASLSLTRPDLLEGEISTRRPDYDDLILGELRLRLQQGFSVTNAFGVQASRLNHTAPVE